MKKSFSGAHDMPMPVRDLMRAINRSKILNCIRTAGMISRIDIARTTGMSRASITGLTADLIKEGLIIEKKAGEYDGGRRPMLLSLNPSGAYVVGVNLSITQLNVVIVDFEATVIAAYNHPLKPVRHSVEEIGESIVSAVQACIWDANFAKDQISGVGIGIPGLVDADSGMIRFLPNYGWENVNLRNYVRSRLKHPCYIDNSSNTLALAEQWFGEGRGIDHFLVVTIENGVGLGAVVNGRLYRGSRGVACEFGHITIDPDGPLCRCGKKGCLEAYVGNTYLLREARKAAERGDWRCEDPESITYEDVLKAAKNGVESLKERFDAAGRKLGQGLSLLETLFNPEKIIITGKGVCAGQILFDAMEETFKAHQSPRMGKQQIPMIIRPWSEQDWARGAGTLVLQELYKSPVG